MSNIENRDDFVVVEDFDDPGSVENEETTKEEEKKKDLNLVSALR